MALYLIDTEARTVVPFDDQINMLRERDAQLGKAVDARMAETGEDWDTALMRLEESGDRSLIEEDAHNTVSAIVMSLASTETARLNNDQIVDIVKIVGGAAR